MLIDTEYIRRMRDEGKLHPWGQLSGALATVETAARKLGHDLADDLPKLAGPPEVSDSIGDFVRSHVDPALRTILQLTWDIRNGTRIVDTNEFHRIRVDLGGRP